jgi:hypothetical protein
MTPDLIEAAVALADVLTQENRALAALDMAKAMTLLEQKQRATLAFVTAQARAASAPASPLAAEQRRLAEHAAAQLQDLAEENKRLLEHAITVQGRVIGALARVVPRALARTPRYGAGGAIAGTPRPPPVALSARA